MYVLVLITFGKWNFWGYDKGRFQRALDRCIKAKGDKLGQFQNPGHVCVWVCAEQCQSKLREEVEVP